MTAPREPEPKAIVLAAGLGTRMREVTTAIPKPLVQVAGKTLIDYNLDFLARQGVHDVVVNLSHMGGMIAQHLETRRSPAIQFSHEDTPLETGGGIKKALKLLGGAPFFALNSDTILLDGYTPALERVRRAFDDARMDGVLLLHPAYKAIGYKGQGDFFMRGDGRIRRRRAHETAPFIFAGLQYLHPRLFARSPDGKFSMNLLYDMGRDDEGWLNRFIGVAHDGEWLHVGDARGLAQAEDFLRET